MVDDHIPGWGLVQLLKCILVVTRLLPKRYLNCVYWFAYDWNRRVTPCIQHHPAMSNPQCTQLKLMENGLPVNMSQNSSTSEISYKRVSGHSETYTLVKIWSYVKMTKEDSFLLDVTVADIWTVKLVNIVKRKETGGADPVCTIGEHM